MTDVAHNNSAREGHRAFAGDTSESRAHSGNTYIETPQEYGKEFVFRQSRVKAVLQSVLQSVLHGKTYHPTKGAQLSKQITEEVLARCKELGCIRHKLLVQVLLVQNINQTLKASARGLWDGSADGWAAERYENDYLICLAQVYGLYFE